MGNEEMRKWEESTLHFTQQTADILLLQSSNIMCDKTEVNVHPAFIEIIYTLQFAPKGIHNTYTICNGIAYCIMVGKLALHFWQLVSFL